MRAIFLDRDGTTNAGVPYYERVDSVEKVELLDNALEGLRILATLDYLKFFVTNQAGSFSNSNIWCSSGVGRSFSPTIMSTGMVSLST